MKTKEIALAIFMLFSTNIKPNGFINLLSNGFNYLKKNDATVTAAAAGFTAGVSAAYCMPPARFVDVILKYFPFNHKMNNPTGMGPIGILYNLIEIEKARSAFFGSSTFKALIATKVISGCIAGITTYKLVKKYLTSKESK